MNDVGRRDTRKQLILAAERLFAERGIEGVSLREINLAAGQRNTSAAHYHFGSKESLVDAIFEFRRAQLGRRRDEWFDRIEAAGKASEVRSLVEAFMMPLVEEVRGEGDSGSHYLMFLAHLFLQSPDEVAEILRKHQAGEARWTSLVLTALPHLPRQLVLTRLFLMSRHVVISLAVFQRLGRQIDVGFDIYLSNMIDAVVGYLTSPVSDATKAHVAAARSRNPSSPPRGVPDGS